MIYDESLALPPGFLLENYRIVRALGQGGFGITYLAHDEALDTPVAIKEYMPDGLATRADDLQISIRGMSAVDDFEFGYRAFLNEAIVLGGFRDPDTAPQGHPNVVTVLDRFEALGTAYMVMTYLEGETLEDRLDRGDAPRGDDLIAFMHGMLAGLGAVHARGLLHRDIKPGNIFLTARDTPVLIDFGAARYAVQQSHRILTSFVSDGYSPPEQYAEHRETQGPWTDLYAFGATLYHVIMGAPPPPAPDRARGRDCPPVGGVPDVLAGAVDRCLAQHPDDRPQSVDELMDMIGGILDVSGPVRTLSARRRDDQVKDLLGLLIQGDARFGDTLRTFARAFPGTQEAAAFDLITAVGRQSAPDLDAIEGLVDGAWRDLCQGAAPEGPWGEFVVAFGRLVSPDLWERAAYSIHPTLGAEMDQAAARMLAALHSLRADDLPGTRFNLEHAVRDLEKAMGYRTKDRREGQRQEILNRALDRCRCALDALIEHHGEATTVPEESGFSKLMKKLW